MNDKIGPDKFEPGPVGFQIRALRREQGSSLEELARRAGTSAPTLHRYESGWTRFEVRTLRRIAGALEAGLEIRLLPSRRDRLPEPTAGELVRLLSPLFWDADLAVSDLEAHRAWVLQRVLMFGGLRQVRAARRYFGDEAIQAAVQRRGTDARTRSYWRLVLGERCTPKS